ncbi:hypothetical protein G6F32_015370 [Rhizopus arrhizus]|nr:hypothetical protein G6F32_015370 [Rhizopus arrhizus]
MPGRPASESFSTLPVRTSTYHRVPIRSRTAASCRHGRRRSPSAWSPRSGGPGPATARCRQFPHRRPGTPGPARGSGRPGASAGPGPSAPRAGRGRGAGFPAYAAAGRAARRPSAAYAGPSRPSGWPPAARHWRQSSGTSSGRRARSRRCRPRR